MNKKIISIAVIMALPFTANATQTIVTTNTPAAVGADGTVKKASASAPYVTNEPTVEDQTHIASTAYVKGAYNDAIAAVNKLNDSVNSVNSALDTKQAKLVSTGDFGDIYPDVFNYSAYMQSAEDMVSYGDADNYLVSVDALHGAIEAVKDEKQNVLTTADGSGQMSDVMQSAYRMGEDTATFVDMVMEGDSLSNVVADVESFGGSVLTSASGVVAAVAGGASSVKAYVDDKRVTARDTWNSNHETQVQLSTVSQ